MQTLSTKIEKQIFVFSLFMQKSNFDWNVQWIAEWAVEYKARGGSNDKGFAKTKFISSQITLSRIVMVSNSLLFSSLQEIY